jgi:hypothetical protein
MIKILNIFYKDHYKLEISFDDGFSNILDFEKIINFQGIAKQLRDLEYFKTFKILRNGRSFGWDNDYDCCADWARNYIS